MPKREIYEVLQKVQQGADEISHALEKSLMVVMKSMQELRNKELMSLNNDTTQNIEKSRAISTPSAVDETRPRAEEVSITPPRFG